MKNHKLEGYCIRGGEDIADRISKVFEADGVDEDGWAFTYKDWIYYIDGNTVWGGNSKPENFKEITIDEAERIVFGEPEKTFPRMMEVSADGVNWYEREVYGYVDGVDEPWVGMSLNKCDTLIWKHAREIQPEPPAPQITDQVMIKAVERLCEMLGDKYGGIESIVLFDDQGGSIMSENDKELFRFPSIHELIKHLRDEK